MTSARISATIRSRIGTALRISNTSRQQQTSHKTCSSIAAASGVQPPLLPVKTRKRIHPGLSGSLGSGKG
jgi:hypothetical protein